MTNRLLRVEVRDRRLSAAEADVRVLAAAERIDAGTELRGRLLGPRCLFAETVEVAYPLRPVAAVASAEVEGRAVIPEPSLWEPASPHLYAVAVELWQGGGRVEEVQLRHGLRDVRVGPRGLLVNGRPLPLHGRLVRSLTAERAGELRGAGVNLLVADVAPATVDVWALADVFGFFVLGRPGGPETDGLLDGLAGHPSFLGRLVPGQFEMGAGGAVCAAGCPEPLGVVGGESV